MGWSTGLPVGSAVEKGAKVNVGLLVGVPVVGLKVGLLVGLLVGA